MSVLAQSEADLLNCVPDRRFSIGHIAELAYAAFLTRPERESARLRFLDPSLSAPGAPVLLLDRSYLLDFLRRHALAVVWSVLGEKIFIGGHADVSPRLEFIRAHMLDESGTRSSSELVTAAD